MEHPTGTGSALVVVDVQVGVMATTWERDRVVGQVALAVRRAREAGMALVWVRHHDEEIQRDSPAWQWVEALAPRAGEAVIDKRYNSAFEETALSETLSGLGVSQIYLAGAATNWCIRATAYGALERGYQLTLLSDAHTTSDIELAPGRVVTARSMVDDLNVCMSWLSYPGRKSAAMPVADVTFA